MVKFGWWFDGVSWRFWKIMVMDDGSVFGQSRGLRVEY